MRITFLLPAANLSGGVRVMVIYAQRLVRRGHDVLVVYPPPARSSFRQVAKSLFTSFTLPRPNEPEPSYLDETDVPRLELDRWRPVIDADLPDADALISTWLQPAEWAAALSPSKGVKVQMIQGDDRNSFPRAPILRQRVEAAWRLPALKIVVSRWVGDCVREVDLHGPMEVIPNGVDLTQFAGPARLKQPCPTVGFVYSTAPCKGADIILKAITLARRRLPTLQVVAFGSVPPNVPLPEGTEFIFRPAQESLRDIYARCDAWLFGSRAEGFGLPILEAMACRTCVIATPAGAAAELLQRGGGVLVPHESPEAMADAIARVCTLEPQDWRSLSDAALRTARAYEWEPFVTRLEVSLERAIAVSRDHTETLVSSVNHL